MRIRYILSLLVLFGVTKLGIDYLIVPNIDNSTDYSWLLSILANPLFWMIFFPALLAIFMIVKKAERNPPNKKFRGVIQNL